ncbi:hypothetical protein CLM62_16495 [Streptomyces sp. SA15]|nr:hypothetical protein CLM62_16495 [Streptomyces sp. SA15]
MARAPSTLDRHGSGKLGWVDPYGDTLFNEQEAHCQLAQSGGDGRTGGIEYRRAGGDPAASGRVAERRPLLRRDGGAGVRLLGPRFL